MHLWFYAYYTLIEQLPSKMFEHLSRYMNPNFGTFIILEKTACVTFTDTLKPLNTYASAGDIYDATIVYKNYRYYLDLGYNQKLRCTILIPIIGHSGKSNVDQYFHYIIGLSNKYKL